MSESDDCLTIPGRGVTYNDVIGAPPFAPRPYYNSDGDKVCRTSTSTGRSVTVTVATASSNQATIGSTSKTCNIHEICYYCQVFIFISAIITGFALVITGAFMHSQHGELVVFVYIGGLLMCVNSALLAIQCFVRKKQKSRLRCYTNSSRHANSSVQGSTLVIGNQQYIPISSMNAIPPSIPSLRGTVPPNIDNGLISLDSNARASPVHFSSSNCQAVPPQSPHSPTHCDLQIKYLSPTHSAISYKQSVSHQGHVLHHHHHHHHHQPRDKPRFHSPPLGVPVSQQNPTTSNSNQHGNRVVNPRDDWISTNYNDPMTPKKSSGFRDGTSSAVHLL